VSRRPLALGVAVAALGLLASVAVNPRTRFLVGGALVSAGFHVQDHLEPYDFEHADAVETPGEVWAEFLAQNALSSKLVELFPRSREHPQVALLLCMDARLDTAELTGDTRGYYYVVRTAGSVLGPAEQDMLELAAVNGVKVIILTRHTDCAAERAAGDPSQRAQFPALTTGVDEREQRIAEFLARPGIAARVADGRLRVEQVTIDTHTQHVVARGAAP
jgi:hypothetical protein